MSDSVCPQRDREPSAWAAAVMLELHGSVCGGTDPGFRSAVSGNAQMDVSIWTRNDTCCFTALHGMDERGRCFTAVLSTLWLSHLVLNEPGLAMPGITDARDVHGRCWFRRTNVCRTTTGNSYVVELCMCMKDVL